MGHIDEFFALKPQLTRVQNDLLNAFYSARKDVPPENPIPSLVIKDHLQTVEYETDWGLWILRRLDDHLSGLRADQAKAERDRMRQAKNVR